MNEEPELILLPLYILCFQAMKESATELLFGGHETTASTATSLVMFLGLNPEVVDKLRQELMDKVITLCNLSSRNCCFNTFAVAAAMNIQHNLVQL